MSAERLVPDAFDPPRELRLPEFHLVRSARSTTSPTRGVDIEHRAHPRDARLRVRGMAGAEDRGGGAQVRSWVRADVAELDGPLHGAVSRWPTERWPFEHAIYAGRPMT